MQLCWLYWLYTLSTSCLRGPLDSKKSGIIAPESQSGHQIWREPSNEWWQVIEWSGRFEHDPLSFLTPLTIRHWLVLDLRHKDCFHGAEFADFTGGSLWLCMCHDHLGCLVGVFATVAFFGAGFLGEPCPFRRSKKWKASKCSLCVRILSDFQKEVRYCFPVSFCCHQARENLEVVAIILTNYKYCEEYPLTSWNISWAWKKRCNAGVILAISKERKAPDRRPSVLHWPTPQLLVWGCAWVCNWMHRPLLLNASCWFPWVSLSFLFKKSQQNRENTGNPTSFSPDLMI